MATTAEIRGLFSKEHVAIVLLVLGSYYMNNKTSSKVEAMSAEMAKMNTTLTLLNYKVHEKGKLYSNAFGQKRKNKYQAFSNAHSGAVCYAPYLLASGYRVHQTGGNSDRYSYHVCGS